MLEALVLFPLLFLFVPKLLSHYKVESRLKLLGEYWAVDKMLKILQFFGMGTASMLGAAIHPELFNRFWEQNQPLLMHEFQKLEILARLFRKVIRFFRAPPIIQRILKKQWTSSSSQLKLELINTVQCTSKTVGDVFLALFFITDHLAFFHLIGALLNEERTQAYLDWGKLMLVGFHIFNLLRLGCLFSRRSLEAHTGNFEELRIAQCELVAHLLDFTRINPLWRHAIGVEYISIMAIVSSMARLMRIKYK